MVVPWAANPATVSPAGIETAVRPGSRVAITDWATAGTVSSRATAALAAARDPTPGTISNARPWSRHQSTCSWRAEYSATSPEWRRTTAASGWAAYTATTSSNVMPAESRTSAPAGTWSRTSAATSDDGDTTTSARASRSTARTVSRSAAPGPAPTNEITAAPGGR